MFSIHKYLVILIRVISLAKELIEDEEHAITNNILG